MRASPALLSRGFWGRSIDEFQRLSKIAVKSEGIKGPSGPLLLHSFQKPDSVNDCKVMSDVDLGGFSTSHLDWVSARPPTDSSSPSQKAGGYARFYGNISTELPQDRPDVQRTGYSAWRTRDRLPTMFGRSLWDIDSYAYLALRVKSDGRAYFVNVQTESVVPTDLHQHRLFTKRPGEWETVLIKWNDFVRTNQGFVVEPQTEILRQKVKSVGIGLTDRVPGPFEVYIESIWATNNSNEADEAESAKLSQESRLKNKQGKNISWREE